MAPTTPARHGPPADWRAQAAGILSVLPAQTYSLSSVTYHSSTLDSPFFSGSPLTLPRMLISVSESSVRTTAACDDGFDRTPTASVRRTNPGAVEMGANGPFSSGFWSCDGLVVSGAVACSRAFRSLS